MLFRRLNLKFSKGLTKRSYGVGFDRIYLKPELSISYEMVSQMSLEVPQL